MNEDGINDENEGSSDAPISDNGVLDDRSKQSTNRFPLVKRAGPRKYDLKTDHCRLQRFSILGYPVPNVLQEFSNAAHWIVTQKVTATETCGTLEITQKDDPVGRNVRDAFDKPYFYPLRRERDRRTPKRTQSRMSTSTWSMRTR
jgi:hypothetical protein